jgi:acetyl-CoA C-acetyltransferase
MPLRRAAIVSPLRTPVGKFGGALAPLGAGDLAAIVLRELMERSDIDPQLVEDVVFGQGYASGEAPAIGRWGWLAAGLPESVPGLQLDRRCGSGLQAIIQAAMMVQTGAADVVVAGGAESMSNVEHYTDGIRSGMRMGDVSLQDRLVRARVMAQPVERYGVIPGMIDTAETLACEQAITREQSDGFAVRSHHRAATAAKEGRFIDEIVPVLVPQRRGEPMIVDSDEGVRPDASLEKLAALPPLAGGVVTAGNASQQSDAAAACLVVAEEMLSPLGLTPSGWFVGWAAAGCDPARMGLGPVPAVNRLLARSGLSLQDIDLLELNEAFAAQVLAVLKVWGWAEDDERHAMLNVNGSGISLGHPIGATGARIVTTMLHEMRRRKSRYGLAAMCIGGGQGLAAVFER